MVQVHSLHRRKLLDVQDILIFKDLITVADAEKGETVGFEINISLEFLWGEIQYIGNPIPKPWENTIGNLFMRKVRFGFKLGGN